eukprot:TRINITY_DN6034_c0_g1_i1.p2 TRINITY_DN6034_c0_g1~~TRINITY_DN6034_c0_g1_i1.p2  ORF type:complete len:105 (-),score=13.52 TRINITY_DN6034_c0_g1_i1:259-573(-)
MNDKTHEKVAQTVWRIGWETFEVEYNDEEHITMLMSKRSGEISHDRLTASGWERGYSITVPTDEEIAKMLDSGELDESGEESDESPKLKRKGEKAELASGQPGE